MAIPVTVADINAFTNKFIVPRATDVVYKDSPLFAKMVKSQRVKFDGGTQIQEPIIYSKLNGGFYSKGDTFNIAYVQTDAAFAVSLKQAYVGITLYGADDILNRGRAAAFSTVESKMANAGARMAEIMATAFYQDGQSSASDVTTAAGVLSTSTSFDGLLAWIDDGNNSGSYLTATDSTRSFAAIGGITRSDLFATAPTFSTGQTPTSAIAGGNAYVDRAFANFSLNGVNTAYGNVWFGNKFVDTMICQQAGWNKFWNAVQPQQRFMDRDGDLAKMGFPVLKFNAADLVVDKYMPTDGTNGMVLGLNTNYIKLYISESPRYQFSFSGWKEAQNSDNLAGQFMVAGNVTVQSPRNCFKLVGTGLV